LELNEIGIDDLPAMGTFGSHITPANYLDQHPINRGTPKRFGHKMPKIIRQQITLNPPFIQLIKNERTNLFGGFSFSNMYITLYWLN
jgi:hypothetical protein